MSASVDGCVGTDVAVLTDIKTIKVVRRQIPPPQKDQVQIRVNAVGICGSDMAYWAKGMAGGFLKLDFSEKGMCEGFCGQMGHECAGTISAVGDAVTHLKVGDRVAMEPGVPCGHCKNCRLGRYNLCPEMKFIGSAVNRVPGAMGSVFNHSANFCFKIPDHVSMQEGAMFEPLCVALHAVTRAKVGVGHKVLVTGAGPIGLLVVQCALAAGATVAVVTDMVEGKLAMAKEMGATATLKANMKDVQGAATEAAGGKFDSCFECCGVESALDMCIRVCDFGGKVCVVANMPGEKTALRLQEAARREVDIIGVYRYCNLYPAALALVSSGRVKLSPLVSRVFPLDQANSAFEFFATGQPGKVIIQPTAE